MRLKIRSGSLDELKQINEKMMENKFVGLLDQYPKVTVKKLKMKVKIHSAREQIEEKKL